ncbi:hypothetical protein BDZ91DRAFT_712686 [Kalaharituber pfeilii]|nr:hypothetical protein BDZ91DRAFT_712686 [Kalaharituber pfeilii]
MKLKLATAAFRRPSLQLPALQRRHFTLTSHRCYPRRSPDSDPPPPGYYIPDPPPLRPLPAGHPRRLISPGLPIPPILDLNFPTPQLPYSKRNPKLRPLPGPNSAISSQSEALKSNPYARILESPVRTAIPHHLRLPSSLLIRMGVIRRPVKGDGTTHGRPYLLPTNILPGTEGRQITMKGTHVACRRTVFLTLMQKGAWKKLVPDEGSRGFGNLIWRNDMPDFVARGLRMRVKIETQRALKVLPKGAIVVMDDGESSILEKPQFDALPNVGCVLVWPPPTITSSPEPTAVASSTGSTPGRLPTTKTTPSSAQKKSIFPENPLIGTYYTLPSGKKVPLHDMRALFPGSEEAEEIKQILGLRPEAKSAAIVAHHQTYKLQIWLMKLRFWVS